jgi:DNA-binding PadR family transcriptional regulator
MSEQTRRGERRRNDSEELSPLEILILGFVQLGLSTPYDLMSQAGLSVGVSSPALKRLLQDGLLNQTAGPRNRTDYALTKQGNERLRSSLMALRNEARLLLRLSRFGSASRVILLLWLYFGIEEATACIERAAEAIRHEAKKRTREGEDLRDDMMRLSASPTDLFVGEVSSRGAMLAVAVRWLKVRSEASQLAKEADVVESMAELLSDLPASLQMPLDAPAPSSLKQR